MAEKLENKFKQLQVLEMCGCPCSAQELVLCHFWFWSAFMECGARVELTPVSGDRGTGEQEEGGSVCIS